MFLTYLKPEGIERPVTPASEDSWSSCIRRIAQGDAAAMTKLYDHSSAHVFSLLARMLPAHRAAEDALVEVYNQVWLCARDYNASSATPQAWLFRLTRQVALARRRGTAAVIPAEAADKDRQPSAALDQLSEIQRHVIEMTYFGGLNASDVAERMGMPVSEVRQQIYLGMVRLRNEVSNGRTCG